jgi:hypothetical protein
LRAVITKCVKILAPNEFDTSVDDDEAWNEFDKLDTEVQRRLESFASNIECVFWKDFLQEIPDDLILDPDKAIEGIAKHICASFDDVVKKNLTEQDKQLDTASAAIDECREAILKAITTDQNLKAYIGAQKHIILGFSDHLASFANNDNSLSYECWTSKGRNGDNKDWGPVFEKRIQLIQQQKGTIKFIGSIAGGSYSLEPLKAAQAFNIWNKILEKDFQINEAYAKFLTEFETLYPRNSLGPNKNGETTYFELAYLLHEKTGYDFMFYEDVGRFTNIHGNELEAFQEAFTKRAKKE